MSLTVADVSSHCIRAFASSSSVAETIVHVVRRLVSRPLVPSSRSASFGTRGRLVYAADASPPRRLRPAHLRQPPLAVPPAALPPVAEEIIRVGVGVGGGRGRRRRRRELAHRGSPPASTSPRAAAVAADPIVATPAGPAAAAPPAQPARRTAAASGRATRKFPARTFASSRPRTARTCVGRAGAAARWRRAWTDPTS